MNRRGFTLIELMISLVLLAFGIMAVQNATVRLVHQVTVDTRADAALQLVLDRLELVRTDPQYDSLQTRYVGRETSPGGVAGLARVTAIVHTRDSTAAGIVDYQQVTVTVSGTGLSAPIARTVSVGAP